MDFVKHQEYVLDYMFKAFPEQKGMVVAHSIGTGKKIIAIGFLMQYINTRYKFIIVIPHGNKHIWKNECKKLGLEKILYDNINFYTYDEFKNTKKHMKDKIIIFDEAYRISSYLEKEDNPKQYYDKIIKARRILLLTGSPIYDDDIEFRWLINIAAGDMILPIPKKDFALKFHKLNIYNVFIFQWLLNWSKFSVAKSLAFDIIPNFLNSYYNILMCMVIMIEIYHPQSFYDTDVEKIMQISKKYISFFEPSDNINYPKLNLHYKPVSYTTSQLNIWSYLILKATDVEIVKKIMPEFSLESYNFIGNKILGSSDKWLDYGRIIGNITENGQVPIKFIEILDTIVKGGTKRTVIYSNFWEKGCVLFGNFLEDKKIDYMYITPELNESEILEILGKFEREKIPIIIIHPDLLDKIYINSSNQLHVLEPPLKFSLLDRITGMVQRYGSHNNLPLKDRHVDIYVWYASISNFIDRIKSALTNLKTSVYLSPLVNYFYPKNGLYDFATDSTPDYLIIKKYMVVKEIVDELKQYKFQDALTYKKYCCLWRPDENLLRDCLQMNNNMCIKSNIY